MTSAASAIFSELTPVAATAAATAGGALATISAACWTIAAGGGFTSPLAARITRNSFQSHGVALVIPDFFITMPMACDTTDRPTIVSRIGSTVLRLEQIQ